MMKLALSLVFVVGLAMATDPAVDEFRWETIPVAENASQCIYRPEVRSLSCRGSNLTVECPTTLELGSLELEVLGIRNHPNKSFVTPVESRVYELYPRKLDNQTYGNFSVMDGNKTVELYLYYAETNSTGVYGVRITDLKCFTRLVEDVFNASKAQHVVSVVQGANTDKVELFGEILIAKPNNKRWLGFGFPWLGMGMGMGMWGWGLGWGLPFWG